MFPEALKKILEIIKSTGDRVIIFDSNFPDDSYVLMGLNRYTEMLGKPEQKPVKIAEKENLTEEDLTDKINREISMWKNRENLPYLGEEDKPKKAWIIPPQVKDKAQEVE